MGAQLQYFDILIIAALAVFLLLRLRSVLGRRTGHERPRPPISSRDAQVGSEARGDDSASTLPGTAARPETDSMSDIAPQGSPFAEALKQIKAADSSFDPAAFLIGAKAAYELIITAFAKGDRDALKPLLSPEVFASFDAAIAQREARGEHRELTLVGINRAMFTDAAFDGREAEITVTFVSEQIAVTKNSAGAVVEGDPTSVRQITDVWSFARDTQSSDPNWELVATDAA
jgi:predicted lipid-binding transport protein (Tim44 family)